MKSKDCHAPCSDPRIAFFDAQAATWDADQQRMHGMLARLAGLCDVFKLPAGANLLEVGCGSGQITAWLAEQVRPGRVLGIDFSEQMLAQARAKNIPASFRQVDVCSGQFAAAVPERFEVVLCFHSFPHFRDQRLAMHHLAGKLTADGQLLVVHLLGSRQVNDLHSGFSPTVRHDHLPTEESEWSSLLAAEKLGIEEYIDQGDLFLLRARQMA